MKRLVLLYTSFLILGFISPTMAQIRFPSFKVRDVEYKVHNVENKENIYINNILLSNHIKNYDTDVLKSTDTIKGVGEFSLCLRSKKGIAHIDFASTMNSSLTIDEAILNYNNIYVSQKQKKEMQNAVGQKGVMIYKGDDQFYYDTLIYIANQSFFTVEDSTIIRVELFDGNYCYPKVTNICDTSTIVFDILYEMDSCVFIPVNNGVKWTLNKLKPNTTKILNQSKYRIPHNEYCVVHVFWQIWEGKGNTPIILDLKKPIGHLSCYSL